MISIYLTAFFIYSFGLLNILGVRPNLVMSQVAFLGVGLVIFLLVKKIGKNFFLTNGKFFYWLMIFFLVLVLIFGENVRGSRRWLNLYFNFQPSEFIKIFFIIYVSQILSQAKHHFDQRLRFLTILFYFVIPAALVFKQPDLGTTIVLSIIFFTMIFISDIPKKYLFRLFLSVVLLLPFAWFFIKPYQKVRLLSFFNPHLDTQGTSYNMIQAIITIGSGGFFGKGLGLGTQSKLFFLPENYTDFAFASLIEQFGFFGGMIIIILFAILCASLIAKLFKYSSFANEQTTFNFYFTLGFLAYILSQVVINIGMNMGMMPITGITLPLISAGGSSLVSLLLGLALLP